jgi:drug/metabolite transporter (DMT)-like permease
MKNNLIDRLKKEEFLQHTPTPAVTDNKNKFNMNNENNLLNENKAYLIIALSNMCFALLVFHIKLTRRFLKSDFNLNMFILWRGLFLSVMGYIQMKKKNIKDYSFASINSKNWFIIRTLANYFNFFTQILTVTYLRTATAACISSLYPVFVVIVSVLILKEKYYHRYIIGIFICIFGTSIIVLNERGPDSITSKQEANISLGCLFGCLNVLTMTIVVVGGKALLNAGIENEIQQVYIGGVNFSFSLILLILTSTIDRC